MIKLTAKHSFYSDPPLQNFHDDQSWLYDYSEIKTGFYLHRATGLSEMRESF